MLSEKIMLATRLRVALTSSCYDKVYDIEWLRELAWQLVEEINREEAEDATK